jgi:hypothetical protein
MLVANSANPMEAHPKVLPALSFPQAYHHAGPDNPGEVQNNDNEVNESDLIAHGGQVARTTGTCPCESMDFRLKVTT